MVLAGVVDIPLGPVGFLAHSDSIQLQAIYHQKPYSTHLPRPEKETRLLSLGLEAQGVTARFDKQEDCIVRIEVNWVVMGDIQKRLEDGTCREKAALPAAESRRIPRARLLSSAIPPCFAWLSHPPRPWSRCSASMETKAWES